MADYDWASAHEDVTTLLKGDFPLICTKAEAVKNSKGNDMIKATFKVESGRYMGRTIPHNFNITPDNPNAMRFFFGHMAVLGLDGKWFAANRTAPVAAIAAAIEGRRCVGLIGSRLWQGAEREQIDEFKPALGGPGGSAIGSSIGNTVIGGGGTTSSVPPSGLATGGVVSSAPIGAPVGAATPVGVPAAVAAELSSDEEKPPPPPF